ncbi:hypothetical protein Anapl_14165 [Anas platyrhynchos]|uniref:Uncharacterized protein n=1 Tax=Anas platyrhynchos TaxID=8839 RepID=R0L665_ANAPL|nr:hypothetical protein Anapl_14165 [Anas platyrhynchos]
MDPSRGRGNGCFPSRTLSSGQRLPVGSHTWYLWEHDRPLVWRGDMTACVYERLTCFRTGVRVATYLNMGYAVTSAPMVSFSSGVGALVWLWKDELLFCEQAQLQQAAILWLAQALAKAKHQIYLLVPLCCSPEMQLTAPLLLDYFVSVEVQPTPSSLLGSSAEGKGCPDRACSGGIARQGWTRDEYFRGIILVAVEVIGKVHADSRERKGPFLGLNVTVCLQLHMRPLLQCVMLLEEKRKCLCCLWGLRACGRLRQFLHGLSQLAVRRGMVKLVCSRSRYRANNIVRWSWKEDNRPFVRRSSVPVSGKSELSEFVSPCRSH